MASGWTWPLVTSVLRLVFISTLTVVNWAALYRVISTKKYKTGRRQERLLVTSIIVVSLVYLTVVWAPFTFSALKHDLSDRNHKQNLQAVDLDKHLPVPVIQDLESDIIINTLEKEKEDEFVVEYIDLLPNLDVFPDMKDTKDEFTVEYVDLVSDDEDKPIDDDDELNDEFALEYIDIRTGEPVKKVSPRQPRLARSAPESVKAGWTVFFHPQPDYFEVDSQKDIALSPVKQESTLNPESENDGRPNSLSWNSDVQDLVTSSCAYSLAITAVVRLVIMRKFVSCPDGPWVLGIWSGLVVGVPGAITLLVRTLGRTTTHFAPHQPEYTDTGYFLYNIICDVHISEEYVVSVFLEWAALFTLLLIVLAVIFAVAVKTNKGDPTDSYGTLQDEGGSSNSSSVETWARDVVLMVGAIWSWPIKPLVVLILFCLYGSHWTNLVCWMAHVVVAIPVVFIPLAVFLSRPQPGKSPMDIYVIDEDPQLAEETQNQKEGGGEKVQNTNINNNFDGNKVANDESSVSMEGQVDKDQGHAKDNIKFYLGKDISNYGFKSTSKEGEEDKQIILENEWGHTSISEA